MTPDLGVVAAAVAPRGPKGDLDCGATFELVDFLCAARVTGIALFTAAAEYPAFGVEERMRVLYLAAKRSRVPVYAGVGAIGLDDTLTLARDARRAGAEGVLVPPPHFYRYRQDEVMEFYLRFAAQFGGGIPAYLVNIPPEAAIEIETALDLLRGGEFAGIVDPEAKAAQFAALDAAYLSGDDRNLAASRAGGAHGVVSSSASAVPELVVALDAAVMAGASGRVEQLGAMMAEFLAWADEFPFPVIVKVAAGVRGVKVGAQSVPLPPTRQRRLDAFREWFAGWSAELKQV